MTVTEIRRSKLTADTALRLLDRADELGLDIAATAGAQEARALAERLDDVDVFARRLPTGVDDLAAEIVDGIVAGEATPDAVVAAAVRIAAVRPISPGATTQAATATGAPDVIRTLLDRARSRVRAQIVGAVQSIEVDWVEALRPQVAALLDRLAPLVELVPDRCVDEIGMTNVRDVRARRALAEIGEVVAALDEVHTFADDLRCAGLVAAENRTHVETYRWLDTSVLIGSPRDRAWWMINGIRRSGGPGIYTVADLDAHARGAA